MWHGARSLLVVAERARICVSARCTGNQSKDRLLKLIATMPLERTHVPAAQKQRAQIAAQIAERADKYSVSSVYAQVLGSGAPGAPASLYLFTDQKRYLFNCGEGTQRLAHEHKVKLSRLEHIFITTKSWHHLGGLPGVSLTLQDVGVPNITLHGPPGLDELYHATRRFVIMKDMKVSMASCNPLHEFEDSVMTVKYVLIGPDDSPFESDPVAKRQKLSNKGAQPAVTEFEEDDTDYYSREHRPSGLKRNKSPTNKSPTRTSPDRQPISQYMGKKKTEELLSSLSKKSTCSVSYICTFKKRLGTLDLNKCVERGVRPGPLLGLLKQGKDVVLDDGRLVLSADVKTPDELGPVFIVLDVPDVQYLKDADFKSHFADGSNPLEDVPALVVHFSPPHVVNDERYQSFLSKFGPSTQHLVVNGSNSCTGSVAVHRMQHKLHLLDTDIFPLLRDTSVPAEWSQPSETSDHSDLLSNKIALAQFESIFNNQSPEKVEPPCRDGSKEEGHNQNKLEFLPARTLTTFHLRPKRVLDRSMEPKLNIQEYISETMKVEGFPASLEALRRTAEKRRAARASRLAPRYPRLLFLGTGSCIPNKTRNTSAILLQIDENRCMLLDCGEGTYGQLVRFYGPKQVNKVLASLRAIYVSHLHADHHIGLIGVLQGRRRALQQLAAAGAAEDAPLHLLAPGQIMTWLSIYDQQFERIRAEFQLVPNQSLLVSSPAEVSVAAGLTAAVLAGMGLTSVRTCQVPHCPNSFGVALETPAGHKITYSGDTLPCEELVSLGAESTVLIHEATMEDELAGEARAKMHSTTSQAMEVGRRMRAHHTLLTHFSQRYARLPRLDGSLLDGNGAVGIAFDNMQVSIEDLELLPHMYGPLRLMFAEHCVELEMKAAKRAQRLEKELRARTVTPPPGPPRRRPSVSAPKKVEIKKARSISSRPASALQKCTSCREASPRNRIQTQRSVTSGGSTHFKSETCTANPRNVIDRALKPQLKENSSFSSKDFSKTKVVAKLLPVQTATTSHQLDETKENDNKSGYGKPLITPCTKKLTIQRINFISRAKAPSLDRSNFKDVKVSQHLRTPLATHTTNLNQPAMGARCSISQSASPTRLGSPSSMSPSRLVRVNSCLSPHRQPSPARILSQISKAVDRNTWGNKSIVTANMDCKTRAKWQKDLYKSAKYKEAASCSKSPEYDRIEGLNWISWK